MIRILNFFIYSNLLISFSSFCFVWTTFIELNQSINSENIKLLALVFFSTLAIYNYERLVNNSTANLINISDRHNWVLKNKKLLFGLIFISIISVLSLLSSLNLKLILFFGHLGVISFFYSVPTILNKLKITSLRNIPIIKIFLITYVWAATASIAPLLFLGQSIFNLETFLLFIEKALFIFAITLPFDIRDYSNDKKRNIVTIPTIIGKEKTKVLALFCIFIFTLLTFRFQLNLAIPLFVSGLTTAYLIYKSEETKSENYYTGWIDATMIFQLLFLFNFINKLN